MNNTPIEKGSKVFVRSGDKILHGKVDNYEWDLDQWTYLVNGNWYCQSEVTEVKKTPWKPSDKIKSTWQK